MLRDGEAWVTPRVTVVSLHIRDAEFLADIGPLRVDETAKTSYCRKLIEGNLDLVGNPLTESCKAAAKARRGKNSRGEIVGTLPQSETVNPLIDLAEDDAGAVIDFVL
jgi:hypothetical protein